VFLSLQAGITFSGGHAVPGVKIGLFAMAGIARRSEGVVAPGLEGVVAGVLEGES